MEVLSRGPGQTVLPRGYRSPSPRSPRSPRSPGSSGPPGYPGRSWSPHSPPGTPSPALSSPTASPPGCPITALTLLRSCSISPSTIDAVRCYQPWRAQEGRTSGAATDRDRTKVHERSMPQLPSTLTARVTSASSNMYSAALCSLAGRIEESFSPLPLAVQLPIPLPLPLPSGPRRPRSEKKPTPEDQKDQRYLERRRRNNRAAKKSRDARRAREDQVALRAALLEHENAVLRAQVMTLREETHSLRQLLIHNKGLQSLHSLHRDANHGGMILSRM